MALPSVDPVIGSAASRLDPSAERQAIGWQVSARSLSGKNAGSLERSGVRGLNGVASDTRPVDASMWLGRVMRLISFTGAEPLHLPVRGRRRMTSSCPVRRSPTPCSPPVSDTLSGRMAGGDRQGRDRAALATLYLGGFLGPFGSGVLAVLVPELRGVYDATTAEVTAGITVYMLPFAGFQLVSGTVGERLGQARTIRWAYLVFAMASFAAAAATSIGPFLAARALQGAANAFTSPLLLAALAGVAGGRRLGRSMGTFNAVQTAGMVMAPLCGGLVGAIDPRLVFAVPGVVALALAAAPLPPAAGRRAAARPARLRAAFNRRSLSVAVAGGLSFLAVTGLTFLVGLQAADRFGLSVTERGLLIAGFGLAGVLAGRPGGELVDRVGPAPVAVAGALVSGVLVALLGVAGSPAALAAAWAGAGVGSALQWAAINTLAVQSAPENRGGAISVIGTFKFAGSALSPLIWLPVFHARPSLAFALAGATAAAVAFIGIVARGERPAPPRTEREAARAAAQG